MDQHAASQYIQRYLDDRYAQIIELMSRDAQVIIDKWIKEITPKSHKGRRVKYFVTISPSVSVRRDP